MARISHRIARQFKPAEVFRAVNTLFIAVQQYVFLVRGDGKTAPESFRHDFFAFLRKKYLEMASFTLLFVDIARRAAE